jgi:hypothetical protein
MARASLHISSDFLEIATRTIDERKRLCVGDFLKNFKRVKMYQNTQGDILISPVVEIPASEAWIFKDKKTLESIKRGLEDAAKGRISKIDPKSPIGKINP